MIELPVVRAAYLNLITNVLSASGRNYETTLQHFNLPSRLPEKPDAYVPLTPVLALMRWAALSAGIEDVALRAGSQLKICDFGWELREALLGTSSLDNALESFRRLATREQSWAHYRIARDRERVRIYCSFDTLSRPPRDVCLEWLQIMPLIATIRHVAGPAWAPTTITVQAPRADGAQAQHIFPGAQLCVGQAQTGITFPARELGLTTNILQPRPPKAAPRHATAAYGDPSDWDFPSCLHALLIPYLDEGYPNVTLAAKIVGCGVRTLQRRLHHYGLSYTDVVQQARFDAAVQLLSDPKMKVIDAANAVGFADPSHFSRAFRRMVGASPTEFRASQGEHTGCRMPMQQSAHKAPKNYPPLRNGSCKFPISRKIDILQPRKSVHSIACRTIDAGVKRPACRR